MKYHAPTKQFTVSPDALARASSSLLYAMGHIRDMAKKPRKPYKSDGALTPCDYACKGIIDAAKDLGINLGADWGHELDLTSEK
jgi:hypothetical protein